MCVDILPEYPGTEVFCGERDYHKRWLFSATGKLIQFLENGVLSPRPIWRDGDLQKEVITGRGIDDWGKGPMFNFEGIPILVVDCLGDWREELITAVRGEIRIYISPVPCDTKRPPLLSDRQYRLGIVNQTAGTITRRRWVWNIDFNKKTGVLILMKVTAVRTRIIEASACHLFDLLRESICSIPERTVVAITSKVVSLCEGNVVPVASGNKDEIIEKEADFFLPKEGNKYDIYLTIKHNLLVPSAGVDESNTNGYYVLWPKEPQETADRCWSFLKDTFKLRNLGVIITDSASSPLRWGVTGKCIAYCGFKGVNSKIGEPDLFGRRLRMTRVNVADALAAAAVLCMGESNEQTPIALIEDLPFVQFTEKPPTHEEIEQNHIHLEDDLYGQLLKAVKWQTKSGGKCDPFS